jgi:hypothetical protein
MIQRGSGLRFASEAFQGLMVSGYIARQEFQSYEAVQSGVFSLINDTHAAATELLQNAIVGNCATDEGLLIRHERAMVSCAPEQVNRAAKRTEQVVRRPW